MMDNAWPSIIWHLYDYYLQPAGGYFGTKKACEPLHIQFSYDDRSVIAVNGFEESRKDLKASVTVLDANLKRVFTREVPVNLDPDSVKFITTIPEFPADPGVYFVKLTLSGAKDGRVISDNFYWLPSKLSTVDWDKTPDTAWSPIATFEDMTALAKLPKARVHATAALQTGEGRSIRVKLQNPSDKLAFQIRVSLRDAATKEETLPVLWDDNYISLLPGESREIEAHYLPQSKLPAKFTLRVEGWNVDTENLPVN
jgi:exo-1,4-beta-D-glucosaminidase